jgi:hypothetical protein
VDLLPCLAATVTQEVSTTWRPTAGGGLPQSPVPTPGAVGFSEVTHKLDGKWPISTKAFLLAASGIRCLNLSEAVALCSNCIVISIQLAFSILLKSLSNSFDLRPVRARLEHLAERSERDGIPAGDGFWLNLRILYIN